MFIDASALTAMLTHEDEARELLARVQRSTARLTFRWPSGRRRLQSARELDLPIAAAAEAVESYLARIEIKMVNVAPETARIALDAFDRFGKGRHPARLNFGDCFAYGCARYLGEPLMFKGADFPQTDIEAA